MKTINTDLLRFITSKICNFKHLVAVQHIEEDSHDSYQCFKLTFKTSANDEYSCMVEINYEKNKFSLGKVGDSFFGTFKFSEDDLKTQNSSCSCDTDQFEVFC